MKNLHILKITHVYMQTKRKKNNEMLQNDLLFSRGKYTDNKPNIFKENTEPKE